MLTEICQYLRNWFVRDKFVGDFVVEGGEIKYSDGTALPLLPGQYYRVIGSVFNDGVKQLGFDTLTDEPEFIGAVWSMATPPDFIALAGEIEAWCKDNEAAVKSPYQSESFGGYSYSMKFSNSHSGASTNPSWQSIFGPQLSPWRKI